jgi:ssDNA-binding Zn-finger/Zn-ribbon topoisomerase 1
MLDKQRLLAELMNLPSHEKINTICPACGSDNIGLVYYELVKDKSGYGVYFFICKSCKDCWDTPDSIEELEFLKTKKF